MKKSQRQFRSDLTDLNVTGLTRIIHLMVAIMAKCDAEGITMPPDFITHFAVVRHHLMRQCVGPDYSERQFRDFFAVFLRAACEQHCATAARMDLLNTTNQLTQ